MNKNIFATFSLSLLVSLNAFAGVEILCDTNNAFQMNVDSMVVKFNSRINVLNQLGQHPVDVSLESLKYERSVVSNSRLHACIKISTQDSTDKNEFIFRIACGRSEKIENTAGHAQAQFNEIVEKFASENQVIDVLTPLLAEDSRAINGAAAFVCGVLKLK